jgi:hypothetical protein
VHIRKWLFDGHHGSVRIEHVDKVGESKESSRVLFLWQEELEVQGPDELENAICRIGDSDRIDCTGLGWTDGTRAASPANASAYAANA